MDLGNAADLANAGAAWVSLVVGGTALWHTLWRDARDRREREEDRLQIHREWEAGADAILLRVTYIAKEQHSKFALQAQVLAPPGMRISPTTMKRWDRETGVAPVILRVTGDRAAFDEAAPASRTFRGDLNQDGPQTHSTRLALKGSPPGRAATVRLTIIDRAGGATVLRRTVPVHA